MNVTVCSNTILAVICTTEHQNITKIVPFRRPRCSADLVLVCSVSLQISSQISYKYRGIQILKGIWTKDPLCVSVRDGVSVTPLFAHLPLFCAHCMTLFRGCVALQGKPDRTGYLPVRKAALLGVQSGAAAMCWVSFTPSLARRSMFGVLEMQPVSPNIIQRVFQGKKKLYT